jgi:hypothetical protein
MARHRPIYSEAHDRSKYPAQTRSRGSKKSVNSSELGTPPSVAGGILPPYLSDEKRRELRARQLVALQGEPADVVREKQVPLPHSHPLPDGDLQRDMDVSDPRGEYFNQLSGPVNTIFPVVRGPQPTHTKTRILPESEVHPPLPDFTKDRAITASPGLIAAISADDQPILEFDNKMTRVHTELRQLRQIAERMMQFLSRTDDDPGDDDSSASHASNIYKLISTIIEPWVNVLDDEFTQLLSGTEQYRTLED